MSVLETVNQELAQPPKVRLTKRQTEVLSLVAKRQTSKEVAAALYVSKRTVDFHLAGIFERLQVHNREEAARVATRYGLIPFEPLLTNGRGEA